jgi:hypothetical protein
MSFTSSLLVKKRTKREIAPEICGGKEQTQHTDGKFLSDEGVITGTKF